MSYDERDWDPVEIPDVKCVRVTLGGALVCRTTLASGEMQQFLVPLGLVDDDSEVYKPHTEGTLIIPTFLAIEKGLV